jgi:hypothetical protein
MSFAGLPGRLIEMPLRSGLSGTVVSLSLGAEAHNFVVLKKRTI